MKQKKYIFSGIRSTKTLILHQTNEWIKTKFKVSLATFLSLERN